ncbi:DUF4179 domain-containing protein [Clostridium sp. YIM B02505]|uniref:DUF4179 domain-containing protein n=1 Tax=Clostridium yunnanense TaxID=2800325 RepID=A0ABS1EJZ6_9CLOT|nr:DUF4179 domain-containing protein [Clostridium yunnanense]MBK1809665.1 DUF4179 domain-containing protein [Clostridium yunnanense]
MKDMYELFNEIDIDSEQYDSMDIKVPKDLDKTLIKSFRKDKYNKSRFNFKIKNTSKVAVIALVIISGITVSSIARAKDINIIGPFMEYLNARSTIANSEYVKYENDVDLEAKDKNIIVRLKSVVYDGSYIYFSYKVKDGNNNNVVNDERDVHISQLKINNSNIDLEEKLLKDQGIQKKYTAYDTEISYGDAKVDSQVIITRVDIKSCKVDDKANISFSLNKVRDVSGNWDFKFQISKNQLVDKTKRYENLGQLNVNDKVKFDLDAITFSPLGTTIENTIVANKSSFQKFIDGKYTNLGFGYVLVSDKGEEIFIIGEKNISEQDKDNLILKRYSRFTAFKEVPKSLTIIPRVQKSEDLNWNFDAYKYVKLSDIKQGQYIAQGKDCGIVINSIVKKNENTVVNISFKGLDIIKRSNIFVTRDINRYKKYFDMKEGKLKDKEYLDIIVDSKESYDGGIERRYSEEENEYTFSNINEGDYLVIPQYDDKFKLDMKNAKTIDFTK